MDPTATGAAGAPLPALAELQARPQWVGWRYSAQVNPTTGKRKKMPIDPATGRAAKTNNPSTWGEHAAAATAYAGQVGFVFTAGDPYVGVDLDDCIDAAGQLNPAAQQILAQLNSYAEISPSKKGVKVFCRGAVPANLRRTPVVDEMHIEVYSEAQYFTVTGRHLPGTPTAINDAGPALLELYHSFKPAALPVDPAPASAPSVPSAPRPGPADVYPLRWVQKVVETRLDAARELAASAGDGQKHNSRLQAGELLGGLLGWLDRIGRGSLLDDAAAVTVIYDANPPKANKRAERKAITDAVAHGRTRPLDIAPPADDAPVASAMPPHSAPGTPPSVATGYPPVSLYAQPEQPSEQTVLAGFWNDERGDGELLAALYQGRLAYDHAADRWYLWAGHHWRPDRKGEISLLVSAHVGACYLHLATALHIRAELEPDPDAKAKLEVLKKQLQSRANKLKNRPRVRNVIDWAKSICGMTGDEWDADPYLLGLQNGTLDLRSGELRPGQPADFIRTAAPTSWGGIDAPAPRWDQFLAELFDPAGEHAEIPAYLRRLLGYGLLGLTTEHILPIFHGKGGRNGKDTMLATLEHILGDLAGTVSNDVLIDPGKGRGVGAATPHLMALRGKRLAWASETDQGAPFSIAQTKMITGGGTITGRFLHQDEVTFKPSHLLLLSTNFPPKAAKAADDDAFWARVHLIPFTLRFLAPDKYKGAPNERPADPHLVAKLQAEAPGVLAWLVRGCLEYQRAGIQPPAVVQMATEQYRADEDTLGQFIDECCIEAPQAKIGATAIFDRYKQWAEDAGIRVPLDHNLFGKRLAQRYTRKPKPGGGGKIYVGIGLLSERHADGAPPAADDRHWTADALPLDIPAPAPSSMPTSTNGHPPHSAEPATPAEVAAALAGGPVPGVIINALAAIGIKRLNGASVARAFAEGNAGYVDHILQQDRVSEAAMRRALGAALDELLEATAASQGAADE